MTSSPTDPAPSTNPVNPTIRITPGMPLVTGKPPPAKKRRRVWRWVAGSVAALFLLLLLLLVLAPTLAGTGWARAVVVAQVNKNLNGHVEIADYSVSWTGGLKVRGIRVYDAENALVAEIGSVSTQLSLLKALRGNYALGETDVRGVGFTVKLYADGSSNIERLLKKSAPAQRSSGETAPPGGPAKPAAGSSPETSGRPSAADKPGKSGKSGASDSGPLLPRVSGHMVLAECHGVVEQEARPGGESHVVVFDRIEGDVKIPDINSPIENALKIVARADNAAPGTLTAGGVVGLVRNNRLDPAAGTVKEAVDLVDFNLGAAAAALPASVRTLTGVARGNVNIDMADGKAGTFTAALDVQKPTLALAMFDPHESLPLDHLNLTLPPTTIDMSAGPDHKPDWAMRVGDGRTQQISLIAEKDGAKVLNLTAAGDVTLGELAETAANRKPGGTGRIELIAHADVGKVLQVLPRTCPLREGVEVKSAQFQYTLAAAFAPDSWTMNQAADLSGVTGRDTKENRDIALQPLHLAFDGSSFGGGWQVPDLRKLSLVIGYGKSLNGRFEGPTLMAVNGKLDATLEELVADAGQFYDMKGKTASGKVTLTAKAEGDLVAANAAGSSTIQLSLTGENLRASGFVGPSPDATVAQQLVRLDAGAEVDRGADGSVSALKNLKLVAQSGDASRHTLDVDLGADVVNIDSPTVVDPKTGESKPVKVPVVPKFVARKLDLPDLRQAQADFGSLVPALAGLRIDRGSLSLAGSGGAYDGARQSLAFQVSANTEALTLSTVPPVPTTRPSPGTPSTPVAPATPAAPVEVIANYSLPARMSGTYSTDHGTGKLVLSALSVKDNKQWLSIDKAGTDIQVLLPPDGPPAARGELRLAADGAAWSAVSRRLSGSAEDPAAVKLVRAMIEGTLKLADPPAGSAPAGSTDLSTDFHVTQLTLAGDAQPGQPAPGAPAAPGVQNESIDLILRATAEPGFSRLKVSQCDAVGSVFTAHVPSAVVWLTTGTGKDAAPVPTLQKLRQLTATLEVPDAGKAQALLDALFPPKPTEAKEPKTVAAAKPGTPPASPASPASPAAGVSPPAAAPRAKLTAGRLVVTFNAQNQGGQLTIAPDVRGAGLALAAAKASYALGDIAYSSRIEVVEASDAAKPGPDGKEKPVSEQIRQLRIPEFAADVAGTSLRLDGAPIVVNDPKWLSAALASAQPVTRPATGPAATVATTAPAVPPGKVPGIDAAILAAGDIKKLTALLDVLGGREPVPNYQGIFTVHQKFALAGGRLNTTGQGVIEKFVVLDADHVKPSFTENAVRIEDAVSLDNPPAADGQPGPGVLSIGKLTLVMDSSKAGSLNLTGTVRDPSGQREFENFVADVTYDWAQLWPILHPMLEPKPDPAAPKGAKPPVDRFKDMKIAGKGTQRFTLSGKLPADLPFNQAVAFLSARGGMGIDLLDVQGIHVEHLAVPVDMTNGVLAFADGTKPAGQNFPPPASCNGGAVNLGNAGGVLSVDLTAEDMRLSGPKGLKLLDRVTLNPVLSDFLGDVINNPLFVDPKESTGVLDLTVDELNRMPLGKLASQNVPANDGRCELDLSLTGLQLTNQFMVRLFQAIGQQEALKGFRGDVKKYHVSFHKGTMTQDFNMTLAQRKLPLRMFGDVRLADQQLMPLTINLPPDFFDKVARGANLERILPNGFEMPLSGPLRQPQFDLGAAVQRNIGDSLLKNPLQELPGLLNPKKDKGDKGGKPAKPGDGRDGRDGGAKPKDDPLGVIGDVLNGVNAARGGKPPATAPADGRRP